MERKRLANWIRARRLLRQTFAIWRTATFGVGGAGDPVHASPDGPQTPMPDHRGRRQVRFRSPLVAPQSPPATGPASGSATGPASGSASGPAPTFGPASGSVPASRPGPTPGPSSAPSTAPGPSSAPSTAPSSWPSTAPSSAPVSALGASTSSAASLHQALGLARTQPPPVDAAAIMSDTSFRMLRTLFDAREQELAGDHESDAGGGWDGTFDVTGTTVPASIASSGDMHLSDLNEEHGAVSASLQRMPAGPVEKAAVRRVFAQWLAWAKDRRVRQEALYAQWLHAAYYWANQRLRVALHLWQRAWVRRGRPGPARRLVLPPASTEEEDDDNDNDVRARQYAGRRVAAASFQRWAALYVSNLERCCLWRARALADYGGRVRVRVRARAGYDGRQGGAATQAGGRGRRPVDPAPLAHDLHPMGDRYVIRQRQNTLRGFGTGNQLDSLRLPAHAACSHRSAQWACVWMQSWPSASTRWSGSAWSASFVGGMALPRNAPLPGLRTGTHALAVLAGGIAQRFAHITSSSWVFPPYRIAERGVTFWCGACGQGGPRWPVRVPHSARWRRGRMPCGRGTCNDERCGCGVMKPVRASVHRRSRARHGLNSNRP